MTPLRIISFIGGVAGSFYVLTTLSLLVHEVCGHLLAGALCGARSFSFAVTPGFAGWADSDYVRSAASIQFVQYAGIGVNALVGLVVFASLRFRRPPLGSLSLLLFWLAVTESGHAIGYSLQGLLFAQGDAAALASVHPFLRVSAGLVLIALFLILASWALCAIVGFVRTHFQLSDAKGLRIALFSAFVLPFAILILGMPGLPGRSLSTRLAFNAFIIAVLIFASLLATAIVSRERATSSGKPIAVPLAAAWTAIAILVALGVTFFLNSGVAFSLG